MHMWRARLSPLVLAVLFSCGTARADSVLSLPVPGSTDNPREKLNLSIRIPAKSNPSPITPQRERIKSSALAGFDFNPFKRVPQRKFVFDTLRIFQKKKIFQRELDGRIMDSEIDSYNHVGQMVIRVYTKLIEIHRNQALKKFGLVAEDIERLQRVADIFQPSFVLNHVSPVEANKNLDEMISVLKKSLGRGQIRITGVREEKDGSTLVELEVLRGPMLHR